MKPCFYCGGRKVKYRRDAELRVTVKCEKCGSEVSTPYMTEDSARGYWNMKQASLEHAAKRSREAAAAYLYYYIVKSKRLMLAYTSL